MGEVRRRRDILQGLFSLGLVGCTGRVAAPAATGSTEPAIRAPAAVGAWVQETWRLSTTDTFIEGAKTRHRGRPDVRFTRRATRIEGSARFRVDVHRHSAEDETTVEVDLGQPPGDLPIDGWRTRDMAERARQLPLSPPYAPFLVRLPLGLAEGARWTVIGETTRRSGATEIALRYDSAGDERTPGAFEGSLVTLDGLPLALRGKRLVQQPGPTSAHGSPRIEVETTTVIATWRYGGPEPEMDRPAPP